MPSSHLRSLLAAAFAALVAVVWLNQGVSVDEWRSYEATHAPAEVQARAPFLVLYRRGLDENIYFAVASALLGRPYDRTIFDLRGPSPLPPVDVPANGHLHVPYREVPLEYPPPNLLFIVLPRLLTSSFAVYTRILGGIMGALLVASAWLLTRGMPQRAARLLAFAGLMLAHGALGIQRLDAVVAFLVALIVTSARREDDALLGFWSGLAGATKILPFLVGLVAFMASGARLRDRGRIVRASLGALVGGIVGFGPQILLAPGSIRTFLAYHGGRGLHVESTLGVLYGAVCSALGMHERARIDFGSFNFHGAVPDMLAKLSPLLLVALVALVCFRAAQGDGERSDRDLRITLGALAACVAIWLGGKVFSPQYLTWTIPLVVAVPGPAWRRIALAFGAVLLVSQIYYRGFYDAVYLQRPLGVVTMLVRLALLLVFAALVLPRRREALT